MAKLEEAFSDAEKLHKVNVVFIALYFQKLRELNNELLGLGTRSSPDAVKNAQWLVTYTKTISNLDKVVSRGRQDYGLTYKTWKIVIEEKKLRVIGESEDQECVAHLKGRWDRYGNLEHELDKIVNRTTEDAAELPGTISGVEGSLEALLDFGEDEGWGGASGS